MPDEYISREAALKDFEENNARNPRWTPQRKSLHSSPEKYLRSNSFSENRSALCFKHRYGYT